MNKRWMMLLESEGPGFLQVSKFLVIKHVGEKKEDHLALQPHALLP